MSCLENPGHIETRRSGFRSIRPPASQRRSSALLLRGSDRGEPVPRRSTLGGRPGAGGHPPPWTGRLLRRAGMPAGPGGQTIEEAGDPLAGTPAAQVPGGGRAETTQALHERGRHEAAGPVSLRQCPDFGRLLFGFDVFRRNHPEDFPWTECRDQAEVASNVLGMIIHIEDWWTIQISPGGLKEQNSSVSCDLSHQEVQELRRCDPTRS